ncbi:MAG: hypothetical protein ACRCT7_18075 [Shewanella sp.]
MPKPLPQINDWRKPWLTMLAELWLAPRRQRHQDYATIDEGIAPLVNAIRNLPGVTTIASCHGHCSGRIGGPYVYFTAPQNTALQLHQACLANNQSSKIDWALYSGANGDFKQTWTLCSPSIEALAINYRQLALIYRLGWQRQLMDLSIKSLSEQISEGATPTLPTLQATAVRQARQYLSLQKALAIIPGVVMVDAIPSTSQPINTPSLFFKAPTQLALQIEGHLHDLLIKGRIQGQWLLDGQFTPDSTLTYQLYRHPLSKKALQPNELKQIKENLTGHIDAQNIR